MPDEPDESRGCDNDVAPEQDRGAGCAITADVERTQETECHSARAPLEQENGSHPRTRSSVVTASGRSRRCVASRSRSCQRAQRRWRSERPRHRPKAAPPATTIRAVETRARCQERRGSPSTPAQSTRRFRAGGGACRAADHPCHRHVSRPRQLNRRPRAQARTQPRTKNDPSARFSRASSYRRKNSSMSERPSPAMYRSVRRPAADVIRAIPWIACESHGHVRLVFHGARIHVRPKNPGMPGDVSVLGRQPAGLSVTLYLIWQGRERQRPAPAQPVSGPGPLHD